MNHYLVTGGGGFIGSHVVRYLLNQNHRVRVLDNFITGNRHNLKEVMENIELIDGDFCKEEEARLAVKDIDYVIHLGALPSVPRSVKNPMLTTDINVSGTVKLLHAAQDSQVKRIVFASSSSVYGNSPEFPRQEEQVPQPLSPYAVSKLSGEFYLKCFYNLHGLETVCLRFFNVFGPRQDPNSHYAAVIPRFIQAVLSDRPPTVYGDGKQSRDFTFVEDLVNGIYKACHSKSAAGEVINVACGRRISLNHLLDLLRDISNKRITPEYTSPRPGDVRDSIAAIEKARNLLGYEPRFTMAEGLGKTYRWYESQMKKNGHSVDSSLPEESTSVQTAA
ncbi:SDR family oxidoreductase [candidate division KSB1 bacterium]|nr:SDR family oxidoreductase [candidate division KSB1 bacterium]NIR70390.1 SDR family oxidoreductase [candidate division KSB1 bacterium]NIS23069.1 SDR family oxidoreductase [candidate division KSB1 bacterium]NIT71443.1 SDR family oxidoreductase [candidate division KSB1 bacterium]NIU25117.1 SDR family oxidoreductase [candidate division KSB1 bacterium]